MPSDTYRQLYQLIESLPVISSHEHLLPDDVQASLTLDRLFENSYLTMIAGVRESSTGRQVTYSSARGGRRSYRMPGNDPGLREAFLEKARTNSFFTWLEKGLQSLYSLDGHITPANWEAVSGCIRQKHANPRAHLEMLREAGGYRQLVNDPYWDYGSASGHPEFISPTMRTDMFVRCFHPDMVDHDGNSPFTFYPQAPRENFDDYLDFIKTLFTGWRRSGAVAMKSASAYERSLRFGEGDLQTARRVFGRPPETVSPLERTAYEDFLFDWFCRLCMELEVPFQIHTGVARLAGSNPMAFEPVIVRYPAVHFVLFHAGYPWYDEAAGLLHTYSNVSVDMVWVPLLSPTGAVQALHEFLEVAHSGDLICWGGDARTAEESFGALLAWRHVAAKVLSEKVEDGYLDRTQAERLAHQLMYRSAARRYGFSGDAAEPAG